MNNVKFGALVSIGVLAACAPEEERGREITEEVREEAGEARQEVGRAAEEGREELARGERTLADDLREQERSGNVVTFEAVLTGHDPDTVMLKLENGEVFEVNYTPQSIFRRGAETLQITNVENGQSVRVRYRVVDGRRFVEQLDVLEVTPPPAGAPETPPADGTR